MKRFDLTPHIGAMLGSVIVGAAIGDIYGYCYLGAGIGFLLSAAMVFQAYRKHGTLFRYGSLKRVTRYVDTSGANLGFGFNDFNTLEVEIIDPFAETDHYSGRLLSGNGRDLGMQGTIMYKDGVPIFRTSTRDYEITVLTLEVKVLKAT